MNKKYYALINEVINVLNDPEIKKDINLTKTLSEYKDKLEKGAEYNLTCAQLSNIISEYMLINKFKAPKSLLNLYTFIANGNNKYRGFISIINWFN